MGVLSSQVFSFQSEGFAENTFGVVSFKGTEGLSRCYEFEITLVSENLEIDLASLMQSPATINFHRDLGEDVYFKGIVIRSQQLHNVDQFAFYKVYIVPKLWWLSMTRHNQVFLDKTVPEIVEGCLKDGGLTSRDFEFRLQGSYDPLDFVCQYGESHLNFISRWLEREGIYYFFEQGSEGEKVIFTDSKVVHISRPQGDTIVYSPPSGLDALHRNEIVQQFTCQSNLLPESIYLKDYDYMQPSLEVTGSAGVDARGRGMVYYYGDHIRTPEDADRIGKIRAESILCRKEIFVGESSVPFVAPGYTFDLSDHYRHSFNQTYLTIDMSHEGSQTSYMLAGLGAGQGSDEGQLFYRNTFTAIPAAAQFRPERKTEKPRISGSITARIDAAGSGKYAELDDHGRYKVILPFDLSGRSGGKASAWVRMAQPYAGTNHGMHFPLHKGTEVLLSFIDGDPDRPVITGAVPNPDTPSPIRSDNQTMSAITTGGNNRIHIEDQEGSERILMHSPKQNTFVRLGTPNDPGGDGEEEPPEELAANWDGIALATDGALTVKAALKNEFIAGEETTTILGMEMTTVILAYLHNVFGGKFDIAVPERLVFENFHNAVKAEEMKENALKTELTETMTRLVNDQANVINMKADVLNSRIQAVNDRVDGVDLQVDFTNDRIGAVNRKISAISNQMKATATELKSTATALKSDAQRIETTGTVIQSSATQIKDAGTEIKNSGVRILSTTSVELRDSPLIMDG